MTPERSLRGHLIAMLIGAALLVLGQLGSWPPETGFERALIGLTLAAVVIAVSLTAHEWRQGWCRRGRKTSHDRGTAMAGACVVV